MIEAMARKAPFPLQIEDKSPYFMMADLGYICTQSLRNEKFLEVAYAIGDDSNGIRTLSFGGSTELIPLK